MANTFVNKKADLTSNSATTLYTVPTATTAVVKSILVSEDSGNADTITVTITDTDEAVFSLFKTKSISANATSELLSAPLVAQESEIIKVTAATANRLHVVLSALEIKAGCYNIVLIYYDKLSNNVNSGEIPAFNTK